MVFLDKPESLTSFAALSQVKRSAATRKVGHTGTLDPFATGLLVALVGGATRAARFFNGLPKRYRATIAFGTATDTDDGTGEVVERASPPATADALAALDGFRGELDQLPPAYSAVHVAGRRAHEIARAGERPELTPRRVTVHELTVDTTAAGAMREKDGRLEQITLDIACSAGTYIRSIARDLGHAVDSAAHVTHLRRTAIGPFSIDEAVAAQDLDVPRDLQDLARVLPRLPGFQVVEIGSELARRVSMGHRLGAQELGVTADAGADRLLLVVDGRAIAIGAMEDDRLAYDMVLAGGELP